MTSFTEIEVHCLLFDVTNLLLPSNENTFVFTFMETELWGEHKIQILCNGQKWHFHKQSCWFWKFDLDEMFFAKKILLPLDY